MLTTINCTGTVTSSNEVSLDVDSSWPASLQEFITNKRLVKTPDIPHDCPIGAKVNMVCSVISRSNKSGIITVMSIDRAQNKYEVSGDGNWVDNIFISKEQNFFMNILVSLHEKFKYINALILGQPGLGKTTLGIVLSKRLKYTFVKVDCGLLSEASELFHTSEADNGKTFKVPTSLARAIESGNAVIVFDEVNRAKPSIMNSLIGLLDDTRCVEVGGVAYTVAPNVIFIATANIGSNFTGTYSIDSAHKRRFPLRFRMNYLPQNAEMELMEREGIDDGEARKLAMDVIGELRAGVQREEYNIDVGTDLTVVVSRLYAITKSIRVAFEYTVLMDASEEDRKSLSDLINSRCGVFKV